MKLINTILDNEMLYTNKGVFIFKLDEYIDKRLKKFLFSIRNITGEWDSLHNYSFMLVKIPNRNELKVIDMYAQKLIGCGISIPIILKSKEIFKKYTITSSSNKYKLIGGEENKEMAIRRVWEPMVKQGLAVYNSEKDIYIVK